jgi:heat shock protein HslJ
MDVLPTPTPIAGSEEFAGPIWKWISFTEEGQDQLIVDDPFSYTIEFLPDGTLKIVADCNQAEGFYSLENDQISLEILTTTVNTCPQGSLSDGFLRLLSDTAMIAAQGDYLYLDLLNETGRMVLTKADEIVLPTQPPATPTPSPVVTPSPQSSPTPIPTPTLTPTPQANIIFEDDFSTDTGWMIYKADSHAFRWEEGSYYISVSTLNGYIWSTRTVELSDGSVETVANQVEGDKDGYYGVVCRFQTGTDYYAFVINENGSYGIALMKYGLLDFISQGTDQVGIIKRDGQLNTIRGDCVGDTLTLYVNGEKLSEVKDASFTGGEVGIIAITFFQKNSVIRYDRFTVYER